MWSICVIIRLYPYIDIDECSLNTDYCEHICTNTNGSYTCKCKTGFELSSDGHHCSGNYKLVYNQYMYTDVITIDINECESKNGGCDDNCINTIGSFYCTCEDGYELNDNELSCDGEQ